MAAKEFGKAAEQGNAEAQFRLGYLYLYNWEGNGNGVEKDLPKAVYWLQKAIQNEATNLRESNSRARAQFSLGRLYLVGGDGVEKEPHGGLGLIRSAEEYWLTKARLGFDEYKEKYPDEIGERGRDEKLLYGKAQENANRLLAAIALVLGNVYYQGVGVPKDYETGAEYWQKSANFGRGDAQAMLGFMYWGGMGVPEDLVRAYMWFNLAASASARISTLVSVLLTIGWPRTPLFMRV